VAATTRSFADRILVALAAGRIAAGVLAWLSPRRTAQVFGMAADGGQSHYAWRLFGVRDVAIGIGTLASSGPQRRAFAAAGIACDVGDGAAGAIALSRGDFDRAPAASPVTVPVVAIALGIWALRGIGR
jgi:hypothetical protein